MDRGVSDGGIIALTIGMTRPELARTLVCVGANYRNDEHTVAANALFDAEMLERDHPELVETWIRFHDAHQGAGFWRTLVGQVRALLDAEPNYTEADLRAIPVPTLRVVREDDDGVVSGKHFASTTTVVSPASSSARSKSSPEASPWSTSWATTIRPSERPMSSSSADGEAASIRRIVSGSLPRCAWISKATARRFAARGPFAGCNTAERQ